MENILDVDGLYDNCFIHYPCSHSNVIIHHIHILSVCGKFLACQNYVQNVNVYMSLGGHMLRGKHFCCNHMYTKNIKKLQRIKNPAHIELCSGHPGALCTLLIPPRWAQSKVTPDIQVNTSWGLVFGRYIFGAKIPPEVFGCLRLYHHHGPLSCTPHIQLVSKKSYSFNVWSFGLHLNHSFLFKCCLRVSAYSRRTSIFWPTSGSKVGWLKHQLYMRWNNSICRL